MPAKRGGSLKGYEGTNLVFFLLFAVVLSGFVFYYFRSFRSPNAPPPIASTEGEGIISEALEQNSDIYVFFLGTAVTGARYRYQGPQEIPVTDDGLVRQLFEIQGISEIVLDRKMVILQKYPSGRWERIKDRARVIINNHLHAHQ